MIIMSETIIVSMSPRSGPIGTPISLSAMIGTPEGEYHIYWDNAGKDLLRAGRATGDKVNDTFNVPSCDSGVHRVILEDVTTNAISGAQFTVLPKIGIDTDTGVVGMKVQVSGGNFPPGPVSLRYDGKEVAVANAAPDRAFQAEFAVPSSITGEHEITTDPESVIETFTVTPKLISESASGIAGSQIKLKGTGFKSEPVSINYDGKPLTSAKPNSRGDLRVAFKAPAGVGGMHELTTTPESTTETFMLMPRIARIAPVSGPVYEAVTVNGENFAPGEKVAVRYDGAEVSKAVAGKEGNFQVSFAVPPSTVGEHRITSERPSTEKTFTVAPKLVVESVAGPVGTELKVNATGFAPGRRVSLRYDDREVAKATADNEGSFNSSFNVPPSATGKHKVSTEPPSTEQTFSVTPELVMEPLAGPVGTQVSVAASGFAPGRRVHLKYDGKDVGTGTVDSHGSLNASLLVPPSIAGEHKVTTQPASSEQTFTTTPSLVAQPASGPVGMQVKVGGAGFAPGRRVSVIYDDREVTTETTDGDGSFDASFAVPPSASGEHKLGTEPPSCEETFTVTSKLILESLGGPVGMEVKANATGFAPGIRVALKFDDRVVTTAITDDEGSFEVNFAVPSDQVQDSLTVISMS
jgi:hypothetical protein